MPIAVGIGKGRDMKPCTYISESIVLVTPTSGAAYKAKLVTEYGRDATGGLIVVATRFVDVNNAVITINTTDMVEHLSAGQPVAAQDLCVITTEQDVCASGQNLRMVTEYGFDAAKALIVVSTRYVDATNVVVDASALDLAYGQCPVEQVSLSAPGALLSANICVGSPILVPSGNRNDVRTVGTGGDYATYVAAMADATVVDGTILRAVSDVVDTATVNVNRAVIIDFNGFTHSNATSVTQFNVTAALAVLKDGVIHHTKVANTSIEKAITINTATGVAFVVGNTIKVQEMGVVVQGGAMISGNKFEYAGASQTNSHRFITLYKITAETKIDDNEFLCSTIPATTRYTNFVFMGAIAGSTWTAPLWVTRNRQTGGSLRQFVFNEALMPDAGSQLIVAANSFNDFNGGIGLISPALYNGLDKIVIVDNEQGGDAAGNFKGVLFVDGAGTLDDDTVFIYGGNTTAAGALRADYLSLASDTDNIVARKNTIVPPTDPAVEQNIQDALEDTGLLLQDLKGRRTYIVDKDGIPLDGFGTEADPYVVKTGPEFRTSSIEPVVFDTAWVGARADDVGNLAKAVELSTGTILSSGLVTWPTHGLTIGETYYTSQTVAGEFVTPAPTTGLSQALFTVIDANTIDVQVQEGIEFVDELDTALTDFAKVVYVDTTDPSTATIFDDEAPPVTNDNTLKEDSTNLYAGTDGSTWIWNGTAYVTKPIPDSTAWFLDATTTDAGSNKTGSIYRTGPVLIATDTSTQKTSVFPFHLQAGGLSGITTRNANALLSGNANAGFMMEALGATTGQRVSAWRTNAGVTRLSAFSDNGATALFTNPLTMRHSTGFIGFNTDAPNSRADVVGSFGAALRTSTAGTTLTNTDHTVVMDSATPTTASLPAANSTNTRRIYNVKNIGTGLITVAGNIDNVANGSFTLPTGQAATVQSDGASWIVLNKTSSGSASTVFTSELAIRGLTTTPAKATTRVRDRITVISDGSGWSECIVEYFHNTSSGATAGSGIYLFELPAGVRFDPLYYSGLFGIQRADPSADLSTSSLHLAIQASGRVWNSGAVQQADIIPFQNETFAVVGHGDGESGGSMVSFRQSGSSYFAYTSSNWGLTLRFRFKSV